MVFRISNNKKCCIFILNLLLAWTNITAQNEPLFRNPTLTADVRASDLVSRMTLDEKIAVLSGYNDFFLHPCERLGIPAIQMADGPLGVASWGLFGRATAYPAALSLAASWNKELAQHTGEAFAREWRSRGIHLMLAPGVNIYRSSKGARNFEYFGEDPYLTSAMSVALINAVQKGGVMPVIKHFAGNDQEFDRYNISTEVDERTLREIYLVPFEAAVKEAGVKAIMSGYNLLNGTYCSENRHLMSILRDEWGFKGMYMSDWGATNSTLGAIRNGLDLEMGSNDYLIADKLKPMLDSGKVKEEEIDEKVYHIYRACIEMGFFDRKQKIDSLTIYNKENNMAALNAAREGIVLLRNNSDILPLDRTKIRRIAVIGPTANPPVISDRKFRNDGIVYGGGSSKVNPWYIRTDLDGIINAFPKAEILYNEGISNRFRRQLYEQSSFFTATGENGLDVTYYKNSDTKDIAIQKTEARINNQWWGRPDIEGMSDDFCIKWEGRVKVDRDDVLRFFTDAQGAYRLWVDDQMVTDAYSSQSFHSGTAVLKVTKGQNVNIRLIYRSRNCSPAEMRLGYAYESDIRFDEAEKIAKNSDVVICCLGLDGSIELESRDRPFELPYGQDLLIKRLHAINPNIIAVIHAGGAVNISEWSEQIPAILHAFYPGQEGGVALGEIISGDTNPSAKLPFTWERKWEDSPAYGNYDETRAKRKIYYREGIFTGYRGFDRSGKLPLYPFGFGLSYTTFSYDSLQLKLIDEEKYQVEATFRITNTGTRTGAEIAQLYVTDDKSSEPRPMKELKGFEKIKLAPGESRIVRILLDEKAFRYYNPKKKKWIVEHGTFTIHVGSSSADLPLSSRIQL